jgi:hypothetical protein
MKKPLKVEFAEGCFDMTLSQEELVLLAKTQEKIRCEKILQNFMNRHKDNFAKVDLLKRVLRKIREK